MKPYTRAHSRGYLEKRGLTTETISTFSERIGIDQHGNIVFRHDDLLSVTGWEVKTKALLVSQEAAGRPYSVAK